MEQSQYVNDDYVESDEGEKMIEKTSLKPSKYEKRSFYLEQLKTTPLNS